MKLTGPCKFLRSFFSPKQVKVSPAALVGAEGSFWIHPSRRLLPGSQRRHTLCPVPLSLSPCTWEPRREAGQYKNLCQRQLLSRRYQSRSRSRTQDRRSGDEISGALQEVKLGYSVNCPGLEEEVRAGVESNKRQKILLVRSSVG